RAVPVLVVLVWTFFALPILTGLTMRPFAAAVIGLTVHLAAYAAEIYRARIARARHVPGADPEAHCAAPGAGAHAARIRFAPVGHHQGYGDRLGDRRTGADAAVGNAR